MVFLDEYLRQGELGGRRAAAQLSAAVQNYIEAEGDIPLGARIVCRIYANVRGLADVLVRTGVLDGIAQLEDFVRGFTRGKTLFDFVDVGAGKDRADDKIIGECTDYPGFHVKLTAYASRVIQVVLSGLSLPPAPFWLLP